MTTIKSGPALATILVALPLVGLVSGCGGTASAGSTPGTTPGTPVPDTQAPSVPTGLASSAITSSSVVITWTASTDNVGVSGYRIYRGGVQAGTASAPSFSDSGLSASTAYSYTVAAYDAAGNVSAQSAALSVTTAASSADTQAPTVPTNLAAGNATASSLSLSWTASTDNVGVTGYHIFRNGVQVGTSSTTSFTDSGLTASTTYSYTVTAFDAAGNTSAQSSPPASGTTLASSSSSITVTNAFDGVSGPAYSDHPDLGGAVGPNHVVDFVGASFTVHDKTTGAVVQQLTQTQFWTNAGVSPGQLLDPRLVYDPLAARWYAVNAGPYAYLAVSASSDPTGAWKGMALGTTVSGDLLVKVAFDATGVYACHYGGNTDALCYAIPKVDLLWGTQLPAPTLARMASFANLAFELVPAIDLNPGKAVTAAEALLTRQGGQNATNLPMVLIVYKITWSGSGCLTLNGACTASISAPQNISTNFTYTNPGNALQPGGAPPIRGVENHRFMDVFASGGSIFAAHGSQINGRVGFEWFEVRVSDGTVLQQGQLADPSYDLLFPTLAADSNGNIGIGFTKTSATEFPSVYLSGRLSSDPLNTLMTPVLATSGTAGYACPPTSPVGWGTYTSTMRDPSNPLTLWTYQEYGNSATACQWSTRWVAFSL